VLLPLVLGLLALGCGLLLEASARVVLPWTILLTAGFALVVVASQFPTLTGGTAVLAAPLLVALAVVGLALAPRRALALDGWGALAGLVAYLAYAAPTVLSGRATFAGYIKLDDTATYLAMLDRVESHGRDLSGLAPSTYEATLRTSLDYGYPVGSFAPLGVAHRLLGIDPAWLWQPYLAFLGGLLALALYGLTARVVPSRPLRAAVAFVAAQPAILYGYSLWGGIKELAIAVLLVVLAACVQPVLEHDSPRAAIPLAAAAAAIVGVLSLGGAIWLALLLPALVLLVVRRGTTVALGAVSAFAVAGVVFAIPPIVAALDWLPRSGAFTSGTEFGNLIRPLRFIQVAGIWPNGDFRRAPHDLAPTYVLVAVVFFAAAGGLAWAWARRAWEVLLFAGGALVGALVLFELGSPWVAGKALASAAPALVLLALVAAAALALARRRVEAAVLAAAVVGGVGWSNALAYRDVWLAPRDRLAELESIGERYAGQGPALMTEFEPYGARHFLRRLDAEGTSELRRRLIPLRSNQPLQPLAYADIDRFRLDALEVYPTLVLRRSPVASRPPSEYRLVDRRRWYEVWQRKPTARVLVHLPLGNELDPGGVPSCAAVRRLASLPGVRRLVAFPRENVVAFKSETFPLETRVHTTPGPYEIWAGGSFVGRVSADVAGRDVGDAWHQLEWSGQYVDLGRVRLRGGTHTVTLRSSDSGWRPGTHGGPPFPLGPLVVAPVEPARLLSVAPSLAGTLCGRRLDWIDATGSEGS
jgi:hypothetical protein